MTSRLLLSVAAVCALALPTFALDQNDVEYSRPGGKPLTLDLHVPEGSGPHPTVIVVHGGGFDMGNKRMFVGPVFDPLTKAGFAWFSIDYRLAPEAKFPQPVEDLQAAIRWVKGHAKAYRLSPDIAILGESAGAYLVEYVGTHQTPDTHVAAVVDFYGPADLVSMAQQRAEHPERYDAAKLKMHQDKRGDFFGVDGMNDAARAKRLSELSPQNAVSANMPAFLIIHGTADEQVPYEQSPAFCEAIKRAGSQCTLVPVAEGRHGMGNWKAPAQQHWQTDMIEWLRRQLVAGR